MGDVSEMCRLPDWFVHERSILVGATVVTEVGDVGTVRFKGTTSFRDGIWVGGELARPTGRNDGSVQRVRYFRCAPNHGIFTKARMLKLHMVEKPRFSIGEVEDETAEKVAEPLEERHATRNLSA